ncbi:OmpA family protein [Myxococcota bacterium]|nr:OmpA family protein [Myxococcota bacterium]
MSSHASRLVPLALLIGVARPAIAGEPGHDLVELGVSTGALLPSQSHELYSSSTTFHAPFRKAGLDVNLHLALFPFSFAGAEVEGAWSPMQTLAGEGATLVSARGHVVLQIPGTITPFVLAGAGTIGVVSGPEVLGRDFDRAFHWGGGLKWQLAEHVALRLDARDVMSARFGPNAGNTHHFEAMAGLSFSMVRIVPGDDTSALYVHAPVVERAPEPELPPDETPPIIGVVTRTPISAPLDCRRAANDPRCAPAQVIKAELERVHFAWGSWEIPSQDQAALDNAVELLARYPDLEVEIDGHTDSTGPRRYNMTLSLMRAEALRSYLVSKGIAAERLTTRGHGPLEPLTTNETRAGRAENRRGEIRVQAAPRRLPME